MKTPNTEALYARLQFEEREKIKRIARDPATDAVTLRALLYAIAHWQRQGRLVSFEQYAGNWAVAHPHPTGQLRALYPQAGPRMIGDGYSDWMSYGNSAYPVSKTNKTSGE